jgi:oligopeptide/dipeptide ABC transporter ATP-binding protein
MINSNNLLLSVQDLKVQFRRNERVVARVLDAVNFAVNHGETVCLVGESGCGKTVTALTILGLIPRPGKVHAGKIFFKEANLLKLSEEEMQKIRGNQIAMVFQEPMTSLNPVFTIGNQIEEAIMIHEKAGAKEARQRSVELLNEVGIASPERFIGNYPHQLSGGQRQRVMIAMALACNPALLIADEPTTALDVTIQAQILHLFEGLKEKRDMSLLYITHDLGVVANIADYIYVMYAGIITEQGNTHAIFRNPRHPYTQGLLASLPTRAKRGNIIHSIPGNVPDPAYRPRGCPFHPRCHFAIETCRLEFPVMCKYGKDHLSRCPVLYEREKD